jgi:hypothetical protein
MASKSNAADEAQGLIDTVENSISGLTRMVEDARIRIGQLKLERERIEDTRISKAEALQRLDSWLEELRNRGAVAVQKLTFRESHAVELIKSASTDSDGYAVMTSAAAAMVYFFPDVIRAKLASEIDAVYANGIDAIGSVDYPSRLADLDAKLFAAEMGEEKIIQRAEESGLTIHRRLDVNPRVLLEA